MGQLATTAVEFWCSAPLANHPSTTSVPENAKTSTRARGATMQLPGGAVAALIQLLNAQVMQA